MAHSKKLHKSVVIQLMDIVRYIPYSIFLWYLTKMPNLQNIHIALKYDDGLD